MRKTFRFATALCLGLLAGLLAAPLTGLPASADEAAEQKVYQEMHAEVKEDFDKAKAHFDAIYSRVTRVQNAITQWRGATTMRTQNLAIGEIEKLIEEDLKSGRNEVLRMIGGDQLVEGIEDLEKLIGKDILKMDVNKALNAALGDTEKGRLYGYMYALSKYERAFRGSEAKKTLDAIARRFEQADKLLGKAGEMAEFVALFDPNNREKDNPISGLDAVGDIVARMEAIAEPIPGLGHLIEFYAEATKAFSKSLRELDKKLEEARDGSICGQLGKLTRELAELDAHIKGGDCLSFKTRYEWEALLKPLKVWVHDESGETFLYRSSDGASAFLSGANALDLVRAFRALHDARSRSNREMARSDHFMLRAQVTTRSRRIIGKETCDRLAGLFSGRRVARVLRQLGVLEVGGTIDGPTGGRVHPGFTPAEEIRALCLFHPRMRNLLEQYAAKYGNLVVAELSVLSTTPREGAQPEVGQVRIAGQVMQDGQAGFRRLTARRFTFVAEMGVPLLFEVEAGGFLPYARSFTLTEARPFAWVYLAPESSDDAAQKAKQAAEAEAARKAAEAREEEARRVREELERQARAAAERAAREAAEAEAMDQIETGRIAIIDLPEPAAAPEADSAEAGDVAATPGAGTAETGETGETAAPGADMPGRQQAGAGPDAVDIGTPPDVSGVTADVPLAETDPETGPEAGTDTGTEAVAGTDPAPQVPGAGRSVPLSGLSGRVYLGDRVVISASWTAPVPGEAGSLPPCDPDNPTPFTDCEVRIPGTQGAQVVVGAADDTEDLGPAGPPPSEIRYIWQGTEGVTFDPPVSTNGQTAARFERPGEAKVWAQIVQDGETVAEATQQVVTVAVPSLSLRFDPAGGAMVGEEVTATVVPNPPLEADLFTVRWLDPTTANRQEMDENAATIRFRGTAEAPVQFDALVVTPYWGDEIGRVTGQYALQAGSLEVTARSRGPRPQVWDAAAGGLVDLPEGRWLTGQEITLSAAFAGKPPAGPVRWDWQVNPGVTIYNDAVQEPTVTRSAAGAVEATVTARDAEGRELATGAITLAVMAEPVRPDAAQDEPEADESAAAAQAEAAEPVGATGDAQGLGPETADAAAPEGQEAPDGPAATADSATPDAPATDTAEPGSPAPDTRTAARTPEADTAAPVPDPDKVTPDAPGLAPCSDGTAERDAAAGLWQTGLSVISGGDRAGGLAALDQSLALCPDAGRQAQVDRLRTAIAKAEAEALDASCARGGGAYARAETAWRDGLRLISGGQVAPGLAQLEASLAICPNDVRARQVAMLTTQLAARGAAPQASAPAPPEPDRRAQPQPSIPTLDSAAQAARSACDAGGDLRARADALWNDGASAMSGGAIETALGLFGQSLALCPEARRQAAIDQIAQAHDAEKAAERARQQAAADAARARPTAQAEAARPTGPVQKVQIHSILAVQNGPTRPATLSLSGPMHLDELSTYHWNNGRGATPGTLALRASDGTVYGPWPTTGSPGMGGRPNCNWHAQPGIVMPAGTYEVIDSDPSTWSTNAETGHRGIYNAKLRAVDGAPAATASADGPVAAPKPQAAQPQPDLFQGRFAGQADEDPAARVEITVSGGQVSGRVSGSYQGGAVQLAFSGPARADGFELPISGTIGDSSGQYGGFRIEGTIRARYEGGMLDGSWVLGSSWETQRGSWTARKQ